FLSSSSVSLLDLHCFPTRRSSDLMWISNSGIALIGFHVLQAGAKFLAPLDRFTIGTERTEILCSRNFGNETLHELTIVAEAVGRSEEHTSELQSRENLVCRLLLEK